MNKTLLFLIGCLGTRFILAYVAHAIPSSFLPIMGAVALIPAFGFILIYLLNLRQTGLEAQGKIWWNLWRPIHACIYILFALYAFKKLDFSWIILFIDAIIGFIAWYLHYYT